MKNRDKVCDHKELLINFPNAGRKILMTPLCRPISIATAAPPPSFALLIKMRGSFRSPVSLGFDIFQISLVEAQK